jgi:hypothetical protein
MPGLGKERDKEDPDNGNKKDPHDEASHAVSFPVAVSVATMWADCSAEGEFLF